jgi:hypothetical protein
LEDNVPRSISLFWVSTSDLSIEELNNWITVDRILYQIDQAIAHRSPLDSWEPFLEQLRPLEIICSRDPFLKTIYWERRGLFESLAGRYEDALISYKKSIQEGYGAPHLHERLQQMINLTSTQFTPQENTTGTLFHSTNGK